VSRYLIGLDLGTTNCAVAYVDAAAPLRGGRPVVHRFSIPQIVEAGEVVGQETLPSFLYFPTEEERQTLRIGVGASRHSLAVVGVWARDHGALVPGRQVSSAKSWLCNPAVDRTAPILPWGHSDEENGCSPVEASARYLMHIRDTWNEAHAGSGADARFERQRIVLTVPASFDEEARELTVEAAREAGFEDLVLLEEPLAAFYAWIASHERSFRQHVRDGGTILICDVGGGTTDFTLIRARVRADDIRFERTAIGEHLLLGGDNLDLALARLVQAKLGDVRLTLRQQQGLARMVSSAKERLLMDPARDRVTVAVPAAGRAMVGGRLAADLTREEVIETLREGFLPLVAAGDLPARSTRAGLREFGLPYAAEPAITRHLAAFLARAAQANGSRPVRALARPDAVLFNGGFFTPDVARESVIRAIESWFRPGDSGWHLDVLTNRNPAGAVALGAAYYAFAKEHGGVRVSGGSARAYYVAVRRERRAADRADLNPSADDAQGAHPQITRIVRIPSEEQTATDRAPGARVTAVCVMPRGTEEGTTLEFPERAFTVATNRPAAFPLYSSTIRHDSPGDVVHLDEAEIHEHAPLVTILRYGKKSRYTDLPVHLSARFTEVGTLEVWCHSDASEHRWRLQFELRATEQPPDEEQETAETGPATAPDTGIVIAEDAVGAAIGQLRDVFCSQGGSAPEMKGQSGATGGESATPETLVGRVENLLGYARQAWPLALIRNLADVLLECAQGRKNAPTLEARWLNLVGFCLRPGFGATLDEWRMEQLRSVYLSGLTFPKNVQNQAEWLVLWQRVAGGLGAGRQQEIYQRYRAVLGIGAKKGAKRPSTQVEREAWRLLASLELLPASTRVALGDELLRRLDRQPENPAFLWAIGRLGARIPSYGPLNTVVPDADAARWLETLLARERLSPEAQAAIIQMAARTDDAHRDIGDDVRDRVVRRLAETSAPPEDIERVQRFVPPASGDAIRMFGETLPAGLRLLDA